MPQSILQPRHTVERTPNKLRFLSVEVEYYSMSNELNKWPLSSGCMSVYCISTTPFFLIRKLEACGESEPIPES